MSVIIGRIVYSMAGRDRKRPFAVVGIMDDNHVLIADGVLRKLETPKKKKLKHLKVTDLTLNLDTCAGNRALNRAIRQACGYLS